jgi:Ca2+-binding RTX toxin-like protein
VTSAATAAVANVNDAPVITISGTDAASATLIEGNSGLTASGTLTVTDPDQADSVSTTRTVAVTSGSAGTLTNAQLLSMFTVTPASGLAANVGDLSNLLWTFGSGSEPFNFLGAGQSLQLTYTLTVSDGNGGQDTQTVIVNITGTNDAGVDLVYSYSGSPGNGLPSNNEAFGTISVVDTDAGSGAPQFWITSLTATNLATGAAVLQSEVTGDIKIDATTGVLTAGALDENRVYEVIVQVTQGPGSTPYSETFSVITGTNSGGADTVNGGYTTGEDVIFARGQGDVVFAGTGDDHVFGQGGDDQIHGGNGNDVLNGAAGNDRFYFDTVLSTSNVDTIQDFNGQNDDTIYLDSNVFGGLSVGALLPAQLNLTGTASGTGGQIVYNSTTGALYYDPDGAGGVDAIQFATLTGAPSISSGDFFIY